ncbi:hypothetical protein B2G71_10290 [Novosphingobium sp. PC22D]|nr:hypothetical protein B2G71_10290 [Novosphingobium sp. PC22D]
MANTPTGRDFNDAANELGDDAVRATIEAAKPQAEFPKGFTMTGKGLTFKDGNDVRVIAGQFEVQAQTRDKHSEGWGVLIRWYDDDDKEHRAAIARSDLASDGLAVRQLLSKGGLYVSPHQRDRNLLQQFFAQVKIERRARAVTRVGWQDGSFALPDRTIGPPDGDLVVYQGPGSLDHEYRAQGALEGWQKAVARPAEGNTRLVVALCSAFVGPLLAAAGAEGGGLHFRGASSIGKSTALLAAASVWGGPTFVGSWRATANGLEGVAEMANDCLLILDELAQLDPKEAGHVGYLLANGRGKSRASKTGEVRAARSWKVSMLSSGEISFSELARSDGRGRRSPAGQEVRILDVEADAGKGLGLFDTLNGLASGDELARSVKNGAASHFGIAGPAFVQRLLGRLDQIGEDVREGVNQFAARSVPAGATGQAERACRRLGLIAMAGERAIVEGILPWPQGHAIEAARSMFVDWLEARGGVGSAEDTAAIEQVADFLSTHGASRFQPLCGEWEQVVYNRAGFWRDDGVGGREYLIPAPTWRNEVCRGLNSKRVAALLIERRHIVPDGEGKASRTFSAPGMGKARFYVVRTSIFGGDDI